MYVVKRDFSENESVCIRRKQIHAGPEDMSYVQSRDDLLIDAQRTPNPDLVGGELVGANRSAFGRLVR